MTLGHDVIMAIRTDRRWVGNCPRCREKVYGNKDLAEEINQRNDGYVSVDCCDLPVKTTEIHMTTEFHQTVWRHPDASTEVKASP